MRTVALLVLLALGFSAPLAAADEPRGDCVATSTSLQVSVSIESCLRLIPEEVGQVIPR